MTQMTLQAVRQLIANDSYAITFQSLGQYRTALLRHFDSLTELPTASPELPDLDRLQAWAYSNGPGNVPRLPDHVVDCLIDSAGVSRLAYDDKDQTAAVERLVHDTCEELLARLPDNCRAQPEGEAPQAASHEGPCTAIHRAAQLDGGEGEKE